MPVGARSGRRSSTFLLSLVALARFDSAKPAFQLVERMAWLGEKIVYQLGVDGIAMPFVILTTFLMPFCIAASFNSIKDRANEYYALFLLLETLMIGVFASLDLVLFYVFFEAGLIPMFLIIGIWGGARRIYASFKFFLYTLLGSVLMLIAIMAMYWTAGTTDIVKLLAFKFPSDMQYWLWLAFFASFAVKMPMWPVHTWLPDAHVEAPTAASVVLAAVLLKMGGYGFIRFLAADVPGSERLFCADGVCALGDCDHLHLSGRDDAGGYQEADRLFVCRAYGLRDDGAFHAESAGRAGRGVPDGQPRAGFRRALPLRRHCL